MTNRIISPSIIAGIVIVLCFTILSFRLPAGFSILENRLYDIYMRLSESDAPDPRTIALVEIDEPSVQRMGAWPWPRQRIAELVERLDRAGAGLIGLLVPVHLESGETGYKAVRELRERLDAHPLSSQQKRLADWVRENLEQLEGELNGDTRLARAAADSAKVLVPVPVRFRGGGGTPPKMAVQTLKGSLLGPARLPEDIRHHIAATGLDLPYDELARAAAGFGHSTISVGNDRNGRIHLPFVQYQGVLLPSLPLRLSAAHHGEEMGKIQVGQGRMRLKGGPVPLVDGAVLVRFYGGPPPFSIHSAADVLLQKETASFKGRIALVGFGPGLGRTYATPVDDAMPEGRVSATALHGLLNGRCISRPAALNYLEPLVVLFLGLLSLGIFLRMGTIGSVGAALGLSLLPPAAGFLAFSWAGVWVHSGTAVLCILFLFVFTTLKRFLFTSSTSKEAMETNRLLGLSFQSQGLLDLAFDKFKKLPLDDESRGLIYNLGLEFEQKRMINKALEIYEYIEKGGGYRDLGDRIPRLREADTSSTLGSHTAEKGGSVLKEAGGEARSHVGRYEITGELGKGAMGLVYKARDPKINRLLAIKTIRFSDEFEEDVIHDIKARFFSEAEIAGRLSHPSIVTIYDVGDDGDLTYMAMEYLEGTDLDKFTSKGNLLPLHKALHVVERVADALAFAHQANVIHRDIKPANIMLLKNGGVKVTDFGIAKAISSSRTRTGVILGTPNYMSPEQIMGQKIDQRSDIFSLGVLFFQLLTGQLPFRGENLSNLLYRITQVRHPSIREINPKIPKACEQIVDKALAKNPANRFQKASEMAKLLGLLNAKIERLRAQTGQPSPQTKPTGPMRP